MSFWDAFRKSKPVDILDKEMQPKTLDQALELIASQNAQIQGLDKTISDQEARLGAVQSDFDACMTAFGIVRKNDGESVTWDSTHLSMLNESVERVTAEREAFKTELATANARIAELEKDQRTVSAKAREFLAAQGGKPLPVTGNGLPKSRDRVALSEQLDEANRAGNKDEVKRLYEELKKVRN